MRIASTLNLVLSLLNNNITTWSPRNGHWGHIMSLHQLYPDKFVDFFILLIVSSLFHPSATLRPLLQ